MKWIIATSTLLILSQPAFSQQTRPCQQGDIGQTGITGCRTPDRLGARIDSTGTFNLSNPNAAAPGGGGPVVVPNDPLASRLNRNPLGGSPGTTGLGTSGPQARIPSQGTFGTTNPLTGGGSTTGVGNTGSIRTPPVHRSIAPSPPKGSASTATGTGSAGMAGSDTAPSTSMGSGGSATGLGSGSHRIRPMSGSRALRSHSHR